MMSGLQMLRQGRSSREPRLSLLLTMSFHRLASLLVLLAVLLAPWAAAEEQPIGLPPSKTFGL